jgi:hypothetical protein
MKIKDFVERLIRYDQEQDYGREWL